MIVWIIMNRLQFVFIFLFLISFTAKLPFNYA